MANIVHFPGNGRPETQQRTGLTPDEERLLENYRGASPEHKLTMLRLAFQLTAGKQNHAQRL